MQSFVGQTAGRKFLQLQQTSRRSAAVQAALRVTNKPLNAAVRYTPVAHPSAGSSFTGTQLACGPSRCCRLCKRRSVGVRAQSKPDVPDRVIAALPYLVPLFDGLRYGKFFFVQYPAFAQILAPLNPAIRLYFSFPFASLLVFFAVYSGIVNNQNFNRYVRYNAMQAVLLSIILIVPGLLESVLKPTLSGPGLGIYINAYNTIWLFVFSCVAYGIGSCLVGRTPRLPLIADAADQQIR